MNLLCNPRLADAQCGQRLTRGTVSEGQTPEDATAVRSHVHCTGEAVRGTNGPAGSRTIPSSAGSAFHSISSSLLFPQGKKEKSLLLNRSTEGLRAGELCLGLLFQDLSPGQNLGEMMTSQAEVVREL